MLRVEQTLIFDGSTSPGCGFPSKPYLPWKTLHDTNYGNWFKLVQVAGKCILMRSEAGDARPGDMIKNPAIGATVQIIVDTLLARIKAEDYPTDSRLPSERTLAAELGVARNTVREALDVLENQGVIRRRQGSGSFVTYRSSDKPESIAGSLADDISPLDHLVVRGILEPEIVRLAVVNMTPKMVSALSETLSEIEAIQTDVDAFIALEEQLYTQIAKGTGNPLLASCYRLTVETYRQSFRNNLRRRHLTPKRMQDFQVRYNTLFNAITSRDVASAVEFVKLHLVEEQKLLLQDV
jgi:DNA-binding FadR family transcriptional regulator